jgi:hypothetical protein
VNPPLPSLPPPPTLPPKPTRDQVRGALFPIVVPLPAGGSVPLRPKEWSPTGSLGYHGQARTSLCIGGQWFAVRASITITLDCAKHLK